MSFFFAPISPLSVIEALLQAWWHLILFACCFRAPGIKRATTQGVRIAGYGDGVV